MTKMASHLDVALGPLGDGVLGPQLQPDAAMKREHGHADQPGQQARTD